MPGTHHKIFLCRFDIEINWLPWAQSGCCNGHLSRNREYKKALQIERLAARQQYHPRLCMHCHLELEFAKVSPQVVHRDDRLGWIAAVARAASSVSIV